MNIINIKTFSDDANKLLSNDKKIKYLICINRFKQALKLCSNLSIVGFSEDLDTLYFELDGCLYTFSCHLSDNQVDINRLVDFAHEYYFGRLSWDIEFLAHSCRWSEVYLPDYNITVIAIDF
jgi:hypothetical protein